MTIAFSSSWGLCVHRGVQRVGNTRLPEPPGLAATHRGGHTTWQCPWPLSGHSIQPAWPRCPLTLLGAVPSTLHFCVRTNDKLGGSPRVSEDPRVETLCVPHLSACFLPKDRCSFSFHWHEQLGQSIFRNRTRFCAHEILV